MSSSATNPYNWRFVLISQVGLFVISFVLSIYPEYFLPVYILYLIIIFGVTSIITYRSNPILRERKYISEINSSRVLYEQKNVKEIMEKDTEYLQYIASVASKNLRSMLIMFAYTIFILLFYSFYLVKIIENISEGYIKFIIYIIYFESLFLLNFFLMRRYINIAQFSIVAPMKYKITEKGILGDAGTVLHSRHLLNAIITPNYQKNYVEIEAKSSGYPFKIRLYTDNVDKVKDILDRVKRLEMKRQSTNS
ncbi:MAG: DUF2208 family protein [Sulfolobaceae archaeon]